MRYSSSSNGSGSFTMTTFGEAERSAAGKLIDLALAEDLGDRGDLTCAILPVDLVGRALLVARKDGVLAGLPVVALICERSSGVLFVPQLQDGNRPSPGAALARVSGPMAQVLSIERTV